MKFLIEVSRLSDKELESLQNYFLSLEEVDEITVERLRTEIPTGAMGLITIHAAAEPFYIAVHFAKDHWKDIGKGIGMATSAVGSATSAYAWLKKRINERNKKHKKQYVTKKIYAPDGSVASQVEVKRLDS